MKLQADLIQLAKDPKSKWRDMVAPYQIAIGNALDTLKGLAAEPVDFSVVNRVIMDRWSRRTLVAIKHKAWGVRRG